MGVPRSNVPHPGVRSQDCAEANCQRCSTVQASRSMIAQMLSASDLSCKALGRLVLVIHPEERQPHSAHLSRAGNVEPCVCSILSHKLRRGCLHSWLVSLRYETV